MKGLFLACAQCMTATLPTSAMKLQARSTMLHAQAKNGIPVITGIIMAFPNALFVKTILYGTGIDIYKLITFTSN
jgi:hypothetical protein